MNSGQNDGKVVSLVLSFCRSIVDRECALAVRLGLLRRHKALPPESDDWLTGYRIFCHDGNVICHFEVCSDLRVY